MQRGANTEGFQGKTLTGPWLMGALLSASCYRQAFHCLSEVDADGDDGCG